jgi:hypothetical protein
MVRLPMWGDHLLAQVAHGMSHLQAMLRFMTNQVVACAARAAAQGPVHFGERLRARTPCGTVVGLNGTW